MKSKIIETKITPSIAIMPSINPLLKRTCTSATSRCVNGCGSTICFFKNQLNIKELNDKKNILNKDHNRSRSCSRNHSYSRSRSRGRSRSRSRSCSRTISLSRRKRSRSRSYSRSRSRSYSRNCRRSTNRDKN